MTIDIHFLVLHISAITALYTVPVILLCWNTTLLQGIKSGIAVALGGTLSQILYGLIAIFHLVHFSISSLQIVTIISAIGGCLLLYLGLREFWLKGENHPRSYQAKFWLIVLLNFLVMSLNIQFNTASSIFFLPNYSTEKSISDFLALCALFIGFMSVWTIMVLITGVIKHFLSVQGQNYLRYLGGFCLAVYALWLVLGPVLFPLMFIRWC